MYILRVKIVDYLILLHENTMFPKNIVDHSNNYINRFYYSFCLLIYYYTKIVGENISLQWDFISYY